eukprot:385938_1
MPAPPTWESALEERLTQQGARECVICGFDGMLLAQSPSGLDDVSKRNLLLIVAAFEDPSNFSETAGFVFNGKAFVLERATRSSIAGKGKYTDRQFLAVKTARVVIMSTSPKSVASSVAAHVSAFADYLMENGM